MSHPVQNLLIITQNRPEQRAFFAAAPIHVLPHDWYQSRDEWLKILIANKF